MIAPLAFRVIAVREIIRVARQPSRIIAAIGTPALIWVFFSAGFAKALRTPAESADGYAAFLLPGMVTLTATFSAIFSAISLINDRREGFLQAAIVSPAPPWSIALGKAVGGSLVALVQCAALLAMAPLLTRGTTPADLALALFSAMCATLAVTGLGMSLAWKVNSVEGFHGVMNLVLMPMWILSGSVFNPDTASPWLGVVARFNPLTHVTRTMRDALTGQAAQPVSWTVTILFACAGLGAAVLTMSRASRPGGTRNPR
jgi:ABC-2 type transport system permease protein